MESIIFANSPLAEYLEGLFGILPWIQWCSLRLVLEGVGLIVHVCVWNAGNGENEADWTVEPQLPDPSDEYQRFAPPLSSVKARITVEGLKLNTGDPGWARKAKFYELFSVGSPAIRASPGYHQRPTLGECG